MILCVLSSTGFSGAAIIAFIGKKYGWSARACGQTAYMFFLLFGGILWIGHVSHWVGACLVMSFAPVVGGVCRKLAYPELTQDQLHAPEPPLTLFPR